MFTRRSVIAATFAISAAFAVNAQTPGPNQAKFSTGAFKAAQSAGRAIVVEVHADWCPVCTKQKPVSQELRSKTDFKNAAFFVVDFDNQADALKMLKVTRQSTIITFKGAKETSRSTGVSDPKRMEEQFRKAL